MWPRTNYCPSPPSSPSAVGETSELWKFMVFFVTSSKKCQHLLSHFAKYNTCSMFKFAYPLSKLEIFDLVPCDV